MNVTRAASLALAISALPALAGCHAEGGVGHGSGHGANTVSLDLSLTGYAWEGYATHVPRHTEQLSVDLHNLNQYADLYVESPDGSHGCESLHVGMHPESCTFDYRMAGDWYVEVFGWHHDPVHYTLSIGLWPANRHASPWLVDHALAAGAVTWWDDPTARLDGIQRFLPLLGAVVERAPTLPAGEVAFRIVAAGGRDLGKVVLLASGAGDPRTVRLKGVAAHPVTGAVHVLVTDWNSPLVASRYAAAPLAGTVTIRRKNRATTVRLGAATGTGADVQLLVQPRPVSTELGWASIAGETLSLEPLRPATLR